MFKIQMLLVPVPAHPGVKDKQKRCHFVQVAILEFSADLKDGGCSKPSDHLEVSLTQ